jgi:putative NADPH-quinone reductase
MSRKILVLQGHPDASRRHFCHMLATAYQGGAQQGGHEVRTVEVAALDFPLLRTREEWEAGNTPSSLGEAQQAIQWADHLVLVFPLWLGGMPALLRAFLEQVLRPGFAVARPHGSRWAAGLLGGRSARIIVTMGMPALLYRWYFCAHGLKALERNILSFVGVHPISTSLVGLVEGMDEKRRLRLLDKVGRLGRAAR